MKTFTDYVEEIFERAEEEDERDKPDRNVVQQARKAVNMNGKDVTFHDGKTHHVTRQHANKFLQKHTTSDRDSKLSMQTHAQQSHKNFMSHVEEVEVNEADDSMPSKAHIMQMCKDGKSKDEICKMHDGCDQGKLKAMIDDCKKDMSEAIDRLIEGAEEAATLTMAAKDMVDRVTGWMEDTAEMQTESMLELGDKVRDELGSEKSEQFINTVKPALENLYTVFETTREALTGGVAIITGEGAPAAMGTDPEAPAEEDPAMEPTVDAEAGVEEPVADEFGASEPATGGEDPADREKRESINRSRRLGQVLTDSKKKAVRQSK